MAYSPLKIATIALSIGAVLIALVAFAAYVAVRDLRDRHHADERAAIEEGASAGKALDDAGCFDRAIERLRDGRAGPAGAYGRPWLRACLANATSTAAFCDGAPSTADVEASIRWQEARCAKRGFSGLSLCGAAADEAQAHCERRASPR